MQSVDAEPSYCGECGASQADDPVACVVCHSRRPFGGWMKGVPPPALPTENVQKHDSIEPLPSPPPSAAPVFVPQRRDPTKLLLGLIAGLAIVVALLALFARPAPIVVPAPVVAGTPPAIEPEEVGAPVVSKPEPVAVVSEAPRVVEPPPAPDQEEPPPAPVQEEPPSVDAAPAVEPNPAVEVEQVVEPAPEPVVVEPAPDPLPDLGGDWIGMRSDRPLELSVELLVDGKMKGSSVVTVGTRLLTSRLAGTWTRDGDQVRFTAHEIDGPRPARYVGRLSAAGGSGSWFERGKSRGPWSVSR